METKHIIIIGPGKHFGEELISFFCNKGWRVSTISRSDLSPTQKFRSHKHFHGDITKDSNQLLNKIVQDFGLADLVLMNIKTSPKGSIFTVDEEQFVEGIISPLLATIHLIKEGNGLSKPGGTMIVTGGGFKDEPDPEKASLSISKSALHALYLVAKDDVWRKYKISLKTLVIDGKVGKATGNINPQLVVENLFELYSGTKEELSVKSCIQ